MSTDTLLANISGSSMLTNGYGNIDYMESLGGDFYLNYRPISILSLSVTGILSSNKLRWAKEGLKQRDWVYNTMVMCDFFLAHDWSLGAQYGNFLNMAPAWGKAQQAEGFILHVGERQHLSVK